MMHFVEKLVSVRPYRLTLLFNTGEVRVVELESFLRTKGGTPHSAYQSLLDPATFCRARLDPESRTVCWDGLAREITGEGTDQPAPLDLCPDVLYGLSTILANEPAKGKSPRPLPSPPAAVNLLLRRLPRPGIPLSWTDPYPGPTPIRSIPTAVNVGLEL
jgi:hypothetical protein